MAVSVRPASALETPRWLHLSPFTEVVVNRYFVDDSIMTPGGIPLDFHEPQPIKPNFGRIPVGLEVNEASYEEFCDAQAEFRDRLKMAVDE